MTRQQAQHLADRIVNLARTVGANDPTWTSIDLLMLPEMQQKLEAEPMLVIGCLPIGWRIRRSTNPIRPFTVTRPSAQS